METEIVKIDINNIDSKKLEKVGQYIRQGELVAFPTETVYGLGANGLSSEDVKKIFIAKGRPQDNPLILHISAIEDIKKLCKDIKEEYFPIMEKLWPGPLTLIFNKSDIVPKEVTAGGDTVGIRLPSNPIARKFIELANRPIAAPSANISGRPSPTNARDVYQDMKGRIRCIIDGGDSDIGIESTVLDLTDKYPTILRPGFYTLEYLREFFPDIKMDQALVKKGIPKSPGQKYRHYAPKAKMIVFMGHKDRVNEEIVKNIKKSKEKGLKVGLMVFEDSLDYDADLVLKMGKFSDISQMGHLLFKNLRDFDRANIDIIYTIGVKEEGYGVSIMNRLKKASSGNLVYV